MTPDAAVAVRFELEDSVAFARLSGDYNPLHIDPTFARRTQFGGPVVHGVHIVLAALDKTLGRAQAAGRPVALSCTFNNPLRTGDALHVDAGFDARARRLKLKGESNARLVFSATIDLAERAPASGDGLPDLAFAPENPSVQDAPLDAREGVVAMRMSRADLRRMFPALASSDDLGWVADLIATTRLVGMECPGLHSIYGAFKLKHGEGPPDAASSLRYRVQKNDVRYNLIQMAVRGGVLEGTVEAFMRPKPVEQMSLAAIAKRVRPDAFVGQRALVIGGSRGIGELTAKILIAGGADVTLTYASGAADAERIADEAARLARRCERMRLDVSALSDNVAITELAGMRFTHVYYFASPPILKNTGSWDEGSFERFASMYAQAFITIARALLSQPNTGDSPIRFFYPSTVFLDAPEKGFAEYAAAKAAGESLCDYLARYHGAVVARPRLPRMRTDQTSGLPENQTRDAFAVMNELLPVFHAGTLR